MKRGILFCAAVLALAALAAAPASASSKWNFGFKLGASSSNVKWSDDVGDEQAIVEPTFGGLAILNITPTIGLQLEVDYLVTGEKWASETYGTVYEKFGYLHVPVLFRYKFMPEGKIIPLVFAGPVMSFLLSASETGVGDVKEFLKPTDFGLDMGLGAEIALGKIRALIDARYYLGLGSCFSNSVVSLKNQAVLVTAGVIF